VYFQKKRILMQHGKSQGNRDTTLYSTPHLTIAFSQQRKSWPRPSVSASTFTAWWAGMAAPLTGVCNSMCPPMSAHDQCSGSSDDFFLKKMIIGVREESWVQERDFRNFQVNERMNVIKEMREYFGRFFY